MTRLLLGLILTAFSWTVSAADVTLYKVEFIVFENLDPSALQAEHWSADTAPPSLDNAMELNDLTAAAAAAAMAPPATPPAPPDSATVTADTTPDTAAHPSPTLTTAPPVTTPTEQPPPADSKSATAAAATAAPAAATAAEPEPPPPPPMPEWRWLEPAELSLTADEQKLQDSGRYLPLLHIGWIQPVNSSDPGTSIHIYDGLKPEEQPQVPEAGESAGETQEQATAIPLDATGGQQSTTAPSTPAAAMTPPSASISTSETNSPPMESELQPAEEPPHIIDGTFTLRREHYLHADVDLGFRKTYTPEETPAAGTPATEGKPATEETPPEGDAVQPVTLYVRMTQSRRLRGDDLQYLDHPLFGVLFTVSPYEEPATTPAPK